MATKIQIYGQGKGAKDQDQIILEQEELKRQMNQFKNEVLEQIKSTKVFKHGIQNYFAKARLNEIIIMSEHGLQLIDTLKTSHDSEIQCIDVASISKDIVSYSTLVLDGIEVNKQLVVHGLQFQDYLNGIDAKVTHDIVDRVKHINAFTKPAAQHLKWLQIWKCDPKQFTLTSFLNTVSLTPEGDALVLTGNEFLSLWTRDSNLSSHSYSMQLYYAKSIPKNFYAQSLKEVEIGQIIQSQFTPDSRALLCLELDNKTKQNSMKVWYNAILDNLREPITRKKFKSVNPSIDEIGGLQSNIDEMECFQVPKNKDQIINFKVVSFPSTVISHDDVLPICFFVLTSKNQAFLWVENLSYPPQQTVFDNDIPQHVPALTFNCVQCFNCKPKLLDVNYVCLDIMQTANSYKIQRTGSSSKMLDPSSDTTHSAKVRERSNMFGSMVQNSHLAPTKDFIVLLSETQVHVVEIIGLRNYPQRSVDVKTISKLNLAQVKFTQLFDVCNDSYGMGEKFIQDQIKVTGMSKNGQIVQLRKELQQNSPWRKIGEMQVDKHEIIGVCTSDDLPVTAMIQEKGIAFQRQVDLPIHISMSNNYQYLRPNEEFLAVYKGQKEIKQVKWVPHLCQLLVLHNDGQISLVSSSLTDQLLKELNTPREFQDFKQIWREQITINNGRVEFSQIIENTLNEPDIVDFEIVENRQVPPKADTNDYSYDLIVLLITQKSIQLHKVTITYKKSSNDAISGDIISQSELIQKMDMQKKVISLLTSQRKEDDSRVYLASSPVVKCLLKTLNSQGEQEICFVEADNMQITIKWETKLPGQELKVGAKQAAELQPLDYGLYCTMNQRYLGVLTVHVGKQQYFFYLYDHAQNTKYEGYLNLLDFINFDGLDRTTVLKRGFPIDIVLPSCTKNSFVVACIDRIFVVGSKNGEWETLRRIDNVSGLNLRKITSVNVSISNQGAMTVLYNKKWPFYISKFLKVQGEDIIEEVVQDEEIIFEDGQEREIKVKPVKKGDKSYLPTESLCQIDFSLSKSNSLHSIIILQDLFIDGKADFIMKVFIQLHKVILQLQKENDDQNKFKKQKVSSLVNFTVKQILEEINTHIENQVVQQDQKLEEAAPVASQSKKVDKGGFDDFFGGESDDDDEMDLMDFDKPAAPKKEAVVKSFVAEKKEEIRPEEDKKTTEQEFLEIINDLLLALVKNEDSEDKHLIDFLLVFKQIYNKDFFSDVMASTLMRQLYLETESVNPSILKDIQRKANIKQEEEGVIKLLAHHEIYAQMYNEDTNVFSPTQYQNSGQQNLELLRPWDSRKCALALFTVNQDVILDELKSRFDLENNSSWEQIRDLCLPVWIKDSYKLRLIVEWVSKIAYKIAGDQIAQSIGKEGSQPPSKAEATSLWYILMNKKQVLINLYSQEAATGGDKVAQMLGQDFKVDRWQKAAIKNAMVLRQKQRYLLAVTFFILGGDINGALQVIRSSMNDPMLAILTIRMLMLQQPENEDKLKVYLDEVYEQSFIQRGQAHGDIYLISIGLWGQKKYVEAVNSLQERQPTTPVEQLKKQGIEYMFQQRDEFALGKPRISSTGAQLMPLVNTKTGYELQKVIIKLKKAPRVVEALKLTDSSTGYGADMSDLFDNFSAPSQQIAKKEENKITQLELDNTQLLIQLLSGSIKNKDLVNSLFLLRENREHVDINNKDLMKHVKEITMQMLKDQILETKTNPSFLNDSDSVHEMIGSLLDFMLGNDKQALFVKSDMKRQLEQDIIDQIVNLQGCRFGNLADSKDNSMLRHEIELRLSAKSNIQLQIPRMYCDPKVIMQRLENKTLEFLTYLLAVTNEPNINYDLVIMRYQNLIIHQDLLEEIEQIMDSFIIYDHHDVNIQDEQIDDSEEIYFFMDKGKQVSERPVAETKKAEPSKKKFDPLDDMFGGDSSDDGDLMDFDFSAPKKKAEPIKVEEPKKEEVISVGQRTPMQQQMLQQLRKAQEYLQQLNSKVKCSFILYLCLVLIAGSTRKYYLAMELLNGENLEHVLQTDSANIKDIINQVRELEMTIKNLLKEPTNTFSEESVLQKVKNLLQRINDENMKLHLQFLKTLVQQIKSSINKRLCRLSQIKNKHYGEGEDSQQSLYYERWHVDLQDGFVVFKEEQQIPGNIKPDDEGRLLLGYLFQQGHLSAESFEFIHNWMHALLAEKVQQMIEKHVDQFSGHTDNQIWTLLEESPSLLVDLITVGNVEQNVQNSQISRYKLRCELEQIQTALLSNQLNPQMIVQNFKRMSKYLEDKATIQFNNLTILEKRYLARTFNPNSPSYEQLYPIFMQYFFKSPSSMSDYFKLVRDEPIHKALNDQYLALLGQNNNAETDEAEIIDKITFTQIYDYSLKSLKASVQPAQQGKKKVQEDQNSLVSESATTMLVRDLMNTGIEIFKQKSECISDFTFDNTQYSDNIAIGLMTSGSREIPLLNTLLFRNRFENGLSLVDEENLSWEECLHRYDELEQIFYKNQPQRGIQQDQNLLASKDDPISCVIDTFFAHKTLNFRSKNQRNSGTTMIDTVIEPSYIWNGSASDQYLKTTSNLQIEHEDFTQAVDSHPHLPLFISGNRRGIICTWKFGQEDDKSLNQFMPEVDPRQADIKKATIKKLMFNTYGDKILSSNLEGSLAIYQVESNSRQMRKLPIFSLYENVDTKISDFDLVNNDSVIATLSQKSKCVRIYDTLMPFSFGKQAQVMELKLPGNNTLGNLLLVNQRRQTIYSFNGRTGSMTELDMRKNLQIVNTFQLSKSEEITAVCLNNANDTLITGYKDGVVKIHSVDKYYEKPEYTQKQLYLRETIEAFPLVGGKKGSVTKIKINKKNGGLFASSQSGILKLLRPNA